MRIENLFEGYKNIESEDWVINNCSEIINQYIQNSRCMYRGTSSISKKGSIMTKNRTARKAAYATMNIHTTLINSGSIGDFPKREIILTSSREKASSYGEVAIALPVNGSRIACVNSDDIYTGFTGLPTEYLGQYYRSLEKIFNELYFKMVSEGKNPPNVIGNYISTRKDIQKIIDIVCNQELTDDEIEHLSETTYLPTNFISDLLNKKSASVVIEPFQKHKFYTMDTRNISIQPNMEYWTDSPTILIYTDYLEGFYPNIYSLFEEFL
jgi:hypothetical protein